MADYDIAAAFAEIEDELLSSMMRNFSRHRAEETAEGYNWAQWQAMQLKSLEKYRSDNQRKLGKRFSSINEKIEEMLRQIRADGNAAQETELLEAVSQGFKTLTTPSGSLTAGFFGLNDRKLDSLIKATVSDMERAEHAVLRLSHDKYRSAIFNAQVYMNTGAATYEKAVDMAVRDLMRAGLNCVEYRNGARHTLSDYAEMALRTANKRAYLMGEGEKRKEFGITTVVVNSRLGGCPRCARYIGRVFIDDVYSGGTRADGNYPLLSEAIEGGLFHPRCKDSTSTYYEGITTLKTVSEEEMKEMERREQLEQKESYCRNEAKKNRRISNYSLDRENKRIFAHRAEVYEEKAAAFKKSQTDKSTEKSSVINSWEVENYKNSTEKGLMITSDGKKIDFGGTDHHVTGRTDDIKLMDGATFTHNHPTDNTFSQNDIVTGLVKGNLKELRAVTSAGDVHILVNNGSTEEQRKKFSAVYQQKRMKAANAADSKIRKGERINKDEYVKSRLEAFLSENAEDYNLRYVKTRIEKYEKPLENSVEGGIIKSKNNYSVIHNKELSKYVGKPITETDNQSVRELYVANVNNIPNLIDKTLSNEEQARQAFEFRNKFKREARIAMSDEETSEMLERKRPIPTFEELIESKMKRKGMTREEAIEDIIKTASSTNADVNKEFGLCGEGNV